MVLSFCSPQGGPPHQPGMPYQQQPQLQQPPQQPQQPGMMPGQPGWSSGYPQPQQPQPQYGQPVMNDPSKLCFPQLVCFSTVSSVQKLLLSITVLEKKEPRHVYVVLL